uniref:Uncharacterized protein n=1 Tax=Amphimedon queenslandica TaxID=400682 RepID=A0A1X7VAG7_AMPQE
MHVPCSAVKKASFDQIEHVDMMFRLSIQSLEMHSCNFCFAFFPYLEHNDNLKKRDIDGMRDLLEEHCKEQFCPKTSPFISPTTFYGRGRQYSEDIWTLRLVKSLNEFYFVNKFKYTAKDALDFPISQYEYTKLDTSHINVYFFRGSPDIRIRLSSTVSHFTESGTDHDSSSENE